MTIAKHKTGAKHPNLKLIEKAAKVIDEHTGGQINES
jgi:hypothetical protein